MAPPRPQPLWKLYVEGQLKALYGIEKRAGGMRQAKLYAWVGARPRQRHCAS